MEDTKITELQNILDKQFQEWDLRLQRAISLVDPCIAGLIPKPKGIFTKRCPIDNTKPQHEGFTVHYGGYDYYKCPVCEYEYTE
jgi:hypothetical protein